MKIVFDGIAHIKGEGDDRVIEFIARDDAKRLASIGLDPAECRGDCQVAMNNDDPGNFYCIDSGCGSLDGECELRNSGSSYWCSCVVPAKSED